MKQNLSPRAAKLPPAAPRQPGEFFGGAAAEPPQSKSAHRAEAFWHALGPGLTTGAADDDPSGIATYSQAGARYGFGLLWLAVFTFPLMAVVQEMCARIGLVTGRGLAANIKHYFPRWVLYLSAALLFAANSFNIGADLGAMAKAAQLVWPRVGFSAALLAFAIFTVAMQIFVSYKRYAKYLKWLSFILLSYVLTAFFVHIEWGKLFVAAVLPAVRLTREQFFLITGILGTTISPYLFFWQTSQEVEEKILAGKTTIAARRATTTGEIRNMRTDVWSGMFVSNLVMFFIIAVSGATLFSHGILNIGTAAEAAIALRPLAGEGAYLLFALGIIGTGFLAVPVLAGSASYAISESLGWREGLYRKLRQAHAFYGVIIISVILGLLMNFTHLDAIKALIYAAVINGLVAPVVLALIVLLSSNKKVMGDRVNSRWTTALGWGIAGTMAVAGIFTIVFLFS